MANIRELFKRIVHSNWRPSDSRGLNDWGPDNPHFWSHLSQGDRERMSGIKEPKLSQTETVRELPIKRIEVGLKDEPTIVVDFSVESSGPPRLGVIKGPESL